jgi:DNA-binding response OmpR family regulator
VSEENKATLLIVEDDVDLAEMLASYFRTQNYDVMTVNWGEDAIQTSSVKRPDLVILDIRLPDMDGFEVARQLRAHQRTQDIPIIFLTEMREKEDRMLGLEVGGDDYVTKPYDIQELRLRVRNALKRATRGTLTNPVTGLAEGALVDERLAECLETDHWAILQVTIENLDEFRELYGFVASDDVQRAVSLMIHNAIRGLGSSNDFVGQLGLANFILVTAPQNLSALAERIQSRLEQSIDYFYPLKDREKPHRDARLAVSLAELKASDGPFKNLEALKEQLLRRRV